MCRPNKYEEKYGSFVCCVFRKVCDIRHVTPKVFYFGQVTPSSVLYWSHDLKSVLLQQTQNRWCVWFTHAKYFMIHLKVYILRSILLAPKHLSLAYLY